MIKALILGACFVLIGCGNTYAIVESFILKRSDGEYNVTVYSQTDPWIISFEKTIKASQVTFLMDWAKPIWITFKDGDVATIVSEGKKMRGSNLKDEERWKIIRFRDLLEE